MSDTESFESVLERVNAEIAEIESVDRPFPYRLSANVLRNLRDRLQSAHEREIAEALCDACDQCDRIDKKAYEHKIEHLRKAEYARGYHDGQHSMDAEHRAVAMRLRALPMNRVEYDANLHDIIEAVCGTNKAGDVDLRDKLIDLMGGVSDDTCACAGSGACAADCVRDSGKQTEVSNGRVADDSGVDTCCGDGCGGVHMAVVTYDVLGNERHKAICELRKLPDWYTHDGKRSPDGKFNEALSDAIGVIGLTSFAKIRDRLVHLLGGDKPSGIDVLNGADLSNKRVDAMNKRLIDERDAEGRITDEQFDRICAQQEAVLQSTIDSMCEEQDRLQERLRTAELGCDANHRLAEANAKWADDLLDLLRDARDEYVNIQAVCDELRYQREELMRKWMYERAERNELQGRLECALREIDSTKHERDELQAKLDAITEALNG